MDPDTALTNLRTAAAAWLAEDDPEDDPDDVSGASIAAAKLHEAATALDEWMSRGGFPPTEWTVAQLAEIERLHTERNIAVNAVKAIAEPAWRATEGEGS